MDLARRLLPRSAWAAPEVQPLSLGGTVAGVYLLAASIASVVLVTLIEVVRPGLASLGSLLFIPVLASAWLLGRREAVTVSSLALAARIAGYSVAGVDLGTAVAEVFTLAALAIVTSLAAQAIVDSRERAAQIAEHLRDMEILGERERIAMNITDTAIRRLYALSLHLQAASSILEQPALQSMLADAIAQTDQLTTDFRDQIFKSDPDA
jgi:signal transduction histidine kinase